MSEIYDSAKQKMEKSIESLQAGLNTLRTGRASPSLLDNLQCDYYGDKIDVTQIAAIKIPEPRQLLIIPYDKNDVKAIVAALNASDIGINPVVDGVNIRLIMPSPTQERRLELTKKAKGYGEDAKVAIRNVRRDLLEEIKKTEGISEDLVKRDEAEVQKATDEVILEVENLIKEKNAEIMAI
ncbi:MAG: ribosome recycling factor [Bacilli bacterium]|jgi:ribosome recycling factor